MTLAAPSTARLALAVALLSSACESGASSTAIPGGGPPASSSRIGDFVWHDKNRNGIQDPREGGVSGAQVMLLDSQGGLSTTVTDSQGRYEFENLPAGAYRLGVVPSTLPLLALPAPCDAGSDDGLDNDCSGVVVVLPDGETDDSTVDFGFHSRFVPIRFEKEDDFETPLVNGQDVSSSEEFGFLLSIDGLSASGLCAAIFDSDPAGPNAGSSDPDLLVGLGKILILQEDPLQSVPGLYDFPDDDARGGDVSIHFEERDVTLGSIDLIDICPDPGQEARVVLIDRMGRRRIYQAPTGWTEDIAADGPPGYRTLDLTTLSDQPGASSTAIATASEDPGFDPFSALTLEVHLGGSGALDNLIFAPDFFADTEASRGKREERLSSR